MSEAHHGGREPHAGDTVVLTVELDPAEFDEPRRIIWERLVSKFGRERVEDLLEDEMDRQLIDQGMQSVTTLWDNRDQIQVEPDCVGTLERPEQSGGTDD